MLAVSGADEWGAVAGGGRDGVLDAAGDGPAQVAGEGQPRRQPLSPITLMGGLKRLGGGAGKHYFAAVRSRGQ